MPVYMLHGFRWPRAGFTGIRVYVVLHNLEEAAAEYLQQPLTTELLTESLKRTQPDLMPRLPQLHFIEHYDPADESSNTVSQPFAYVGAKVVTIPDGGSPTAAEPGLNIEDVVEQGSGLSDDATEALEALRDRLAPGEHIGWFMVYNGDPDRFYPESEEEEDYDDEECYVAESEKSAESGTPGTPATPQSYTVCFSLGCLNLANVGACLGSIDEAFQSHELFIAFVVTLRYALPTIMLLPRDPDRGYTAIAQTELPCPYQITIGAYDFYA